MRMGAYVCEWFSSNCSVVFMDYMFFLYGNARFYRKIKCNKKMLNKNTESAHYLFSLSLSSYIKYYVFHVHFSYLYFYIYTVCVWL